MNVSAPGGVMMPDTVIPLSGSGGCVSGALKTPTRLPALLSVCQKNSPSMKLLFVGMIRYDSLDRRSKSKIPCLPELVPV